MLLKMAEVDRSYTNSYQSATVSTALSCFRVIWHWRISRPWNL